MAGILYLVSTPIGNLEDISQRALRILQSVQLVACEDTRHTRKLLTHFNISTRTTSYHEHNERQRAAELMQALEDGADVALVSDAGTPGISDPGFRLVRSAVDAGIQVVPVPGPAAFITALVASGLPTDEFYFAGFLPPRGAARRTKLAELRGLPATLVFYEAPHRIVATLKDALEVLGDRQCVVGRELTKIHEEIKRGSVRELLSEYEGRSAIKGEIVLIIDRTEEPTAKPSVAELSPMIAALEAGGLDSRAALKKVARQLGLSRDEAYRRLAAERARGSRRS